MTEEAAPPSAGRRRLARIALASCGVVAVVILVMVLIASMHKTSGISGILSGVFVGLFAALFVGAAGAWIAMSLLAVKQAPKVDDQTADELLSALRPVLAELESARREVVQQVNARAMIRVPVSAAAGGALWFLEQLSGRSKTDGVFDVLFNAVSLICVGAMAGYYSAARQRKQEYARLYVRRVLPLLAQRFGNEHYGLACALGAAGESNIALSHLDTAIQLLGAGGGADRPLVTRARSARAETLVRLDRLDEADAEMAALAKIPRSAEEKAQLVTRLALLRSRQGRHEEAVSLAQTAGTDLAAFPSKSRQARALSIIGRVLLAANHPQQAIAALERSVALFREAQVKVSPDLLEAETALTDARRARTPNG